MANINLVGDGAVAWSFGARQDGQVVGELSTSVSVTVDVAGAARLETNTSTTIAITVDLAGVAQRVSNLTVSIPATINVDGQPQRQLVDVPCVDADPRGFAIVGATMAGFALVSGQPSGFRIVSATIRVCGEVYMALCPTELNFDAGNQLALEDVVDNRTSPPTPLTSAATVSVRLFDKADDSELPVSPITLAQDAGQNDFRQDFVATALNGFAVGQRLRLEWSYSAGGELIGFFITDGLVVAGS